MNLFRAFPLHSLVAACALASGCFGPTVDRVRDSSGHEFTLESAVETARNLEGCVFEDFKVVAVDCEGIRLEDRRKGSRPAAFEGAKHDERETVASSMGMKGTSGKEWACVVGWTAFFALMHLGHRPNAVPGSGNGDLPVVVYPWNRIEHVRIVYPAANLFLAFSLAFLVLPNFYVLDICDVSGDTALSLVPPGQLARNFLPASGASNLGACRKIAAAMLYLRDRGR